MSTGPEPLLPDYGGACLSSVVPALVARLDRSPREGAADPPDWLPATVPGASQIVLLVLDGLGSEQLASRAASAPTLASAVPGTITSVAPSTTASALTSLVTGLPPAVHGVVGYRVRLEGEILNVLRWQLGGSDARRRVPARRFQPFAAFPGRGSVPVVSRSDYATTGFTAAHLGDSRLHGWHVASSIAVEVRDLLRAGEPFVYAYYDGIDRVSHARGLGDHYEAELRAADRIVADVLEVLPPGAVLVVTADHGQVEVGPQVEVLGGDLMAGVDLVSGEGRFRWLHVRPGATEDVKAAARSLHGHVAWVRTREEVIEEGWLGGEPVPAVADRLGDVLLAPFEPTAFLDPADTGEQRLVGRHGSVTAAEMLIPLLSWPSPG
ncbi:MAG TPA: alkaline phosphatase family protein [Acidimicrobiales bacterium]|nr:alkaline phosphatase family protein [Acidimicrobiales bacterium]